MNPPGNQLRSFAARWCCAETMERMIDPLIADLQREHAEAVRSRRIWKSRWIQIAGWVAFGKVIALCAVACLTSQEEWTPEDRKSLTRAAVIGVITVVVITVLLVSASPEDIPKVLMHPSPKRFFFLAPYPFVAGIVLGATLGIVLGLGGRALSRRLVAAAIGIALVCSVIVFIDVGWVAPAAHVAYRMTVGGSDPTRLDIGEASLGALRQKIDQVRREFADAPSGFLAALSFDYHQRVALSFSPLVFTLFALIMAGCFRRRWLLGMAVCAAFLVYGWLVIVVRPWYLQPWNLRAPAFAAAWLPNAAMATLAAVLGFLGSLRRAVRHRQASRH
jgi:hypothetical protein